MLITGFIYSNQHKQIYIIVSICTYMYAIQVSMHSHYMTLLLCIFSRVIIWHTTDFSMPSRTGGSPHKLRLELIGFLFIQQGGLLKLNL